MPRRDRDILERAVVTLSERALMANDLVDEAMAARLDGSHLVTIHEDASPGAPESEG
jgi:hypothetical protein